MKKYFFVICFYLLQTFASGQKLQYGGMQQLGILVGEQSSRLAFSVTNGIRFNRFFAGIGNDILFNTNSYFRNANFRSAAVFLDGRCYVNKKKNFFARAAGGVNLIAQKLYSYDYAAYKKKPGSYCAFGLGFKAKLGKEIYYSFDINYCIRQTRFNYDAYSYWTNQLQSQKFDIKQYAILVNLGIEIF